MVDPSQMLESVAGALGADGRTGELRLKRANGKVAYIQFPMERASSILLNIEQALGQLFEAQRSMAKGVDPRALFPVSAKHVSRIQGAVAPDGTPILSLVLSTGIRIDVTVDRMTIPELITWLEQLAEDSQKVQSAPPRKPS